ncbi:hypothetical protein UFOVP23_42 [uncultured Caudovirales phage]|uniref:Uncharacterized protein n=1 Tax=uncultured Caudovirales phage TaxID=2100421 RepID=A0A6J5T831_9CAUD|nr:hypothetical protein UFOVP23_42 [uncultured Caudovirales phage]
MAIAINSNFERNQLVASFTGQTDFTYDFPIFSETYLSVFKYAAGATPDDRIQQLVLHVDYTVVGVGEATGGMIILTVGATNGDVVTIMGTEPIERQSVFQDLNPFTQALNQQLNEQTVMAQQSYTYWNNFTPRYNADELVSDLVRPQKRILPMLPDGHVWVGRGSLGTNPDDIVTMPYVAGGGGGTGNVVAAHPGMKQSIAQWTGTDFILTDSDLLITGAFIGKAAGDTEDRAGWADEWGAMHWPAHVTGSRPAVPSNGDSYYDTTLNEFFGYQNGVWVPFQTGTSPTPGGTVFTVTQANTFMPGDWVRLDVGSGLYVVADNTNDVNAECLGMVETIVTINLVFTIRQSGPTTSITQYGALIPGRVYFLDLAGKMSLSETGVVGEVSLPVFLATDTSAGEVLNKRGLVISTGAPINVGDGLIKRTINQTAHGLTVGQYVRLNTGGNYVPAQADNIGDALGLGFVVAPAIDADHFILQVDGYVGPGTLTALITGEPFFLDPTSPGSIIVGSPSLPNEISKPVCIPDSTDSFWIVPWRPLPNTALTNPAIQLITQSGHGFIAGNVVKTITAMPNTYALAQATNLANAYLTVGIVTFVVSATQFVLQQSGFVTFDPSQPPTPTLSQGVAYFLSASTPGLMDPTEPIPPFPSRPVMQATSTSQGWITPNKPTLIPSLSNAPVIQVTQNGHGFVAGNWLKTTLLANTYALAQATTLANAYATAGQVIFVIDANNFLLQQSGFVVYDNTQPPTPSIITGNVYFLSPTVAGSQQILEPAFPLPSRPTFQATTTMSGWILPQKPTVIPTGGGGGGAYVLIETVNLSGTGPFDFTNIFDGTYADVKIVGRNLTFLASVPISGYGLNYAYNFAMQLYNGPTLDSTANNYAYNVFNITAGGSSAFRPYLIIPGTFESGVYFYSSLNGASLSFETEMFAVSAPGKQLNCLVGSQYFAAGSGSTTGNANILSGGMVWGGQISTASMLGITGFRLFFTSVPFTVTGGTVSIYGIKA